jgi:hypothetical protein
MQCDVNMNSIYDDEDDDDDVKGAERFPAACVVMMLTL